MSPNMSMTTLVSGSEFANSMRFKPRFHSFVFCLAAVTAFVCPRLEADSARFIDTRYVPADKKLEPAWVQSLTAKGDRKVYTGDELKFIGMPCGGIGAGQIEITGEGTLGTWWIFNEAIESNQGKGYSTGHHYPIRDRRFSSASGSHMIDVTD